MARPRRSPSSSRAADALRVMRAAYRLSQQEMAERLTRTAREIDPEASPILREQVAYWERHPPQQRPVEPVHREALRALCGIPAELWDEPATAAPDQPVAELILASLRRALRSSPARARRGPRGTGRPG